MGEDGERVVRAVEGPGRGDGQNKQAKATVFTPEMVRLVTKFSDPIMPKLKTTVIFSIHRFCFPG